MEGKTFYLKKGVVMPEKNSFAKLFFAPPAIVVVEAEAIQEDFSAN